MQFDAIRLPYDAIRQPYEFELNTREGGEPVLPWVTESWGNHFLRENLQNGMTPAHRLSETNVDLNRGQRDFLSHRRVGSQTISGRDILVGTFDIDVGRSAADDGKNNEG